MHVGWLDFAIRPVRFAYRPIRFIGWLDLAYRPVRFIYRPVRFAHKKVRFSI